MKSKPVSVIVADPHDIFAAGFSNLIHQFANASQVAVVQNVKEFKTLFDHAEFDIAFIDADFFLNPEVTLIEECRKRFPGVRIIGMSMQNDPYKISAFLKMGIRGFILKTISSVELQTAFEHVIAGTKYVSSQIEEKLNLISSGQSFYTQSYNLAKSRVRELIFLICNELTSKEIASKMNLSEKTVEKYRKQLLDATGSRNVVGLALYGFQNNIISDNSLRQKFRL